MMKDAGYDVDTVVADKGYDPEKVHEEFRIGLGTETVIPVRAIPEGFLGKRDKLPSGRNRRIMFLSFPKETYNLRQTVETVNSMIKRKMSGRVHARSDVKRDVEIRCRCIAHNIRRMIGLGVEI